jgi:hypothetical protein
LIIKTLQINRKAQCLWLGLLLAAGGCNNPDARNMTDLIQVMLSQDSFARWVACVLVVFVVLQVWRLFRLGLRLTFRSIRGIWQFFIGWARERFVWILLLGTLVWWSSDWWVDLLQEFEQRFLSPVYVSEFNYLNQEHIQTIYETELSRHVDPYQQRLILESTRNTAAAIGSSALCILEAAWLECGLNPFEVRKDKVAAGWIQFTRVGVGGLQHNGRPVQFEQVLEACARRDAELMMNLTDQYLKDKYQRAGRKPLNNTIDLYLAIFAPALIGAPTDKVLYSGWNDPKYYKNAGLDGWYTIDKADGKKLILRKQGACDGKITIWEVFLCLEAKKNRLLNQYLRLKRN